MDWVWLSSAIEPNQTPNTELSVSSISAQIELWHAWEIFHGITPGIVNQTFKNRTQSMDWDRLRSAIEPNRTPDFQWVRFPNKSNLIEQIELNQTQSNIQLCLIKTELNRTQLNGLHSIGSGKPIQSKPKASLSMQVFLMLFYNSFNNRNPIYKLFHGS